MKVQNTHDHASKVPIKSQNFDNDVLPHPETNAQYMGALQTH